MVGNPDLEPCGRGTKNLSVVSETPRRTSLRSETQARPAGAFSITRFEGMPLQTDAMEFELELVENKTVA